MKLVLMIFSVVISAATAFATKSAPTISQTCVACHGAKGISISPMWPNLAGQKADYLAKQMNDFREGRRQDPIMGPMAKTLSEDDVRVLADYFSSL